MEIEEFYWKDKQKQTVKLYCPNCGHKDEVPRYHRYTGHEVNSCFHYVCPECRDQLMLDKSQNFCKNSGISYGEEE